MGGVPVEMSRERFEELVGDALDEVPEELLALMSNVVILVEDDPPPARTCSASTRGTPSPTAAGTTPACCRTAS